MGARFFWNDGKDFFTGDDAATLFGSGLAGNTGPAAAAGTPGCVAAGATTCATPLAMTVGLATAAGLLTTAGLDAAAGFAGAAGLADPAELGEAIGLPTADLPATGLPAAGLAAAGLPAAGLVAAGLAAGACNPLPRPLSEVDAGRVGADASAAKTSNAPPSTSDIASKAELQPMTQWFTNRLILPSQARADLPPGFGTLQTIFSGNCFWHSRCTPKITTIIIYYRYLRKIKKAILDPQLAQTSLGANNQCGAGDTAAV